MNGEKIANFIRNHNQQIIMHVGLTEFVKLEDVEKITFE